MRVEVCHFCSSKVYPGHGTMFVRNDAKVFRFCRKKCHIAFKQRKNPRKIKWTKSYRKTTARELSVDPSFDMERKRNVPVKYTRELWGKAVNAIKTVTAIQDRRIQKHMLQRLSIGIINDQKWAKQIVQSQKHLIELPAAQINRERNQKKLVDEVPMEQDETPFTLESGTSHVETKKQKAVKKIHDSQKTKAQLVMEEKLSFEDDSGDDDEEDLPHHLKLDPKDDDDDMSDGSNEGEWDMDQEQKYRPRARV